VYIESIEIFNFGAIKYKKLDFVDGLVVVRGANEQGKSTTVIQAPLYAFFGSSTLDSSLDFVVHHNEPVNSLKVIVKYGPYTVSRTKSSASVIGPGVAISGQKEVSDFFYSLFGIFKGTETMVLVSEQGDTAGVIKRKNGEITSFIEDIAGFDQIEMLLDRIKETYPTGNDKALKAQLENLEAEKTRYQQEELPDMALLTLEKELAADKALIHEANVSAKRAAIKILEEELKKVELSNQSIEALAKAVSTKKSEIKYSTAALVLAEMELERVPTFEMGEVEYASNFIDDFPALEKRYKAYQWVSSLKPAEAVWDESEEALVKVITGLNKNIVKARELIASTEGEIKTLKKGIQVDTVCTKCGTDVKDKVEAINKEIDEDIGFLESKIRSYRLALQGDEEEKLVLDQILAAHQKLEREFKLHEEYVSADCELIPHTYSLDGDIPTEPSLQELKDSRQLVFDHQKSVFNSATCKAVIKEKTSAIDRLKAELAEKELELKDAGEVQDLTEKRKEIFDEEIKLKKLSQAQTELNTQLLNKEKEIVAAEAKISTNKKNIERVVASIIQTESDLRVEDRNGKIVKSVRDAKPKVLNQIWGRVLDYTQQAFSEMRGVESKVERSEKGFLTDGRPVSRLSGSAKSILGVSLRAAVRDIFAPTCGFMIYDEPFGDMDEERTASALAAIQTIRGQKFIVTHESQSEMAADQVVEI